MDEDYDKKVYELNITNVILSNYAFIQQIFQLECKTFIIKSEVLKLEQLPKMEMLNKIKTKITQTLPLIFTTSQNTIKKDTSESVLFIIDEIVFQLNSIPCHKERKNMKDRLVKNYNKFYVKWNGFETLELLNVGKNYFSLVKATNQKKFNYGGSSSQNVAVRKTLHLQIYSIPENLRHFWGIDFLRLKVLNISNYLLSSIEGLSFMNVPNLVCIQLHSNHITNIDCLAKASLPKLKMITLYENEIIVGDKLIRGNFPRLTEFEFDNQQKIQSSKIQCLDFIFKIQNPHLLQKIFALDKKRISNNKKITKIQSLGINKDRIKFTPVPIQMDYQDEMENLLNQLMHYRQVRLD